MSAGVFYFSATLYTEVGHITTLIISLY